VVEIDYDLEIVKLKRNGVANSVEKPKCHNSFVRDHGIMTISFEFGSDHHYGIKGDLDHWIRGKVNEGHPIKVEPEVGKG
jgi:hypothetical protein